MPAGATVYSFDTEEEMLLSFRHFVQDAPMDRLGESPVETFSKSQQRHKISELGQITCGPIGDLSLCPLFFRPVMQVLHRVWYVVFQCSTATSPGVLQVVARSQ